MADSTFVNLCLVSNVFFLSSNGRTFTRLGGLISSSSSLSLYFSFFLRHFFSLILPIFIDAGLEPPVDPVAVPRSTAATPSRRPCPEPPRVAASCAPRHRELLWPEPGRTTPQAAAPFAPRRRELLRPEPGREPPRAAGPARPQAAMTHGAVAGAWLRAPASS
jgi:hypothetical protein